MTSADLASLYDAQYYRAYRGAPYERSELWLTLFGAMADGIVRDLNPGTVLDVGCALGLLVEALRERGVEAYGVDFSTYAIDQVRDDVKPYCWVGSVLDAPTTRRYDLVICYEVLEHLPAADANQAVANLCQMADDILFSSSPDDFTEDTHLNVRPAEYWAGLFAKHGFVRDVDFDPLGVFHQPAVRFRRTAESLHRIIANLERGFSRLSQENVALRSRALETKALIAQHEQALAEKSSAIVDVSALELTIAEQTAHLDAQAERLMYMSDREAALRSLMHDAHEQLLQRDEAIAPLRQELDERGKVIAELDHAVKERTAWAERMVAEAEARGRIIDDLRRQLDAQTDQQVAVVDASSVEQEVAALQQLVEERTAWAERMVAEAEARGRIIDQLQQVVEERTAWAERMTAEAEDRGRLIDDLQHLVEDLRRGVSHHRTVSKEAQAVAFRFDKPPVRALVRGYRRLRRHV